MTQFDDQLELDWGDGPKVWVVAARLVAVRRSLGKKPAAIARSISASRTSISNWELGSKQPTHFLRSLAEVLEVTPSALGLPAPASVVAGPYFRSTNVAVEPREEQAIAIGQLYADALTYLEKRVGLGLSPMTQFATGTHPSVAAIEMRSRLQVPPGPIANMIRLSRQAGAVAMYGPTVVSAIDAFSLCVGRWPLILLASRGDYYRQRWSVAHELGHLVLHQNETGFSDRVEAEANAFAAELLLPATEIRDLLPISIASGSLEVFREIKEEWGVSVTSLVRRSWEVGRMHPATYEHAKKVLQDAGYYRREPGRMETFELATVVPDALERYLSLGIAAETVLREIGIPISLFTAATSRLPLDLPRRAPETFY